MIFLTVERVFVKDFTLPQLEGWVESIGERRFRARQLFRNVYVRRIRSYDECTDLSRMFRVQLEHGTHLDALELVDRQESSDGTRKYLFQLHDGHSIESVWIPDPPRYTLCISSQAGCALGCRFCLTGTMGLKRNLSAAEIVDQVCQVLAPSGGHANVTNLVFMGMGEPLANYDAVLRAIRILNDPNGLAFSHRRITLSTAGIVPKLIQLGQESPVNLAVSLHAAEDALRSELMPINRTYPLDALIQACRTYPLPPRKRITFEMVLLRDVNDGPKHAKQLVRLLQGVRAKVNLLPFNPYEGAHYERPSDERVLEYQDVLQRAQLTAMIRQSRGADISAACGQLAGRAIERNIDIET